MKVIPVLKKQKVPKVVDDIKELIKLNTTQRIFKIPKKSPPKIKTRS
jgi:hypothetical protein